MPSKYGKILSLVVIPTDGVSPFQFAEFISAILNHTQNLDRQGHPAPKQGPGVSWPPYGATLEAHAQRGRGSLGAARRKALFESFVAWAMIKTGVKIAGFDARRYRRIVGENADFRKFEDGLKMTIDCDPRTEAHLRSLLEDGVQAGTIEFGVHAQSEAMMTCIVPSIFKDSHIHFVDGASGGYTAAALALKHQKDAAG